MMFGREYNDDTSRAPSRRNSILPRRSSMISGDAAVTMERRRSVSMARRSSFSPDSTLRSHSTSPRRQSIRPADPLAIQDEEINEETIAQLDEMIAKNAM